MWSSRNRRQPYPGAQAIVNNPYKLTYLAGKQEEKYKGQDPNNYVEFSPLVVGEHLRDLERSVHTYTVLQWPHIWEEEQIGVPALLFGRCVLFAGHRFLSLGFLPLNNCEGQMR